MSDRGLTRHGRVRRQGELLFINRTADGYPVSSKVHNSSNAARARRWQACQRSREQKEVARQDAQYARSLVGWHNVRAQPDTSEAQEGEHTPDIASIVAAENQQPPLKVTMTIEVHGGLRVDPFNALPIESNVSVMEMADYYVHVWVNLKRTNLDTRLGTNSYLKYCWPMSQQDDMLFSATLAVSRAAWCLSQKRLPHTDKFVLQHEGNALAKLRARLTEAAAYIQISVLFAMDYLVNIAYMTDDRDAFDVHWNAFKQAAQAFLLGMGSLPVDPVMASIVRHRLHSWHSLYAYRKGTEIAESAQPISSTSLTYMTGCNHFQALPRGFKELMAQQDLSVEVAGAIVTIALALQQGLPLDCNFRSQLLKLPQQSKKSIEAQICRALIGMCICLTHHSDTSHYYEQVDSIAQAFLNALPWMVPRTVIERSCLISCCLVLGSTFLQLEPPFQSGAAQRHDNGLLWLQRLRCKGHVILVAVKETLLEDGVDNWNALKPEKLCLFLTTSSLLDTWRNDWETTMQRQKSWELNGQLAIGKPIGTRKKICLEYLVLRDGRESLPLF